MKKIDFAQHPKLPAGSYDRTQDVDLPNGIVYEDIESVLQSMLKNS